MKLKYSLVGLLLPALLSISGGVWALPTDSKQPIEVQADMATADIKNMSTVFSGQVVIKRGSLIVHAQKAVANEDKAGNRTLTLTGNPVSFTQKAADDGTIEGQGNQFIYDSKSNLAKLSGRARVRKGNNIVIGETITYNTQTEVYSASGTPNTGLAKKPTGRVTVILDQIKNDVIK